MYAGDLTLVDWIDLCLETAHLVCQLVHLVLHVIQAFVFLGVVLLKLCEDRLDMLSPCWRVDVILIGGVQATRGIDLVSGLVGPE